VSEGRAVEDKLKVSGNSGAGWGEVGWGWGQALLWCATAACMQHAGASMTELN
jgi:hypothetical protein